MAKLGSNPDQQRRRFILALRTQGLTLQEIGDRLGISYQCVHKTLKLIKANEVRPAIACCRCGREVARRRGVMRAGAPVLCLECLARQPSVTFAEWLRAHRLAAGLTQQTLAKRAGVETTLICGYERDKHYPRPVHLAKLIRVFGVGRGTPWERRFWRRGEDRFTVSSGPDDALCEGA
jgi:transcriptional regulator with XRE-family HTH domain